MIEKLALSYDPIEDRLLLMFQLLQDGQRQTVRLHLTRRVCAVWNADLSAMKALAVSEPRSAYAKQPPVKRQLSPPVDAQPSARTASEQAPPGAEGGEEAAPMLVARISCARRRGDGRWVLRFHAPDRQLCSLVLSDQGLEDIHSALKKQLKTVRWEIPEQSDAAFQQRSKTSRPLH